MRSRLAVVLLLALAGALFAGGAHAHLDGDHESETRCAICVAVHAPAGIEPVATVAPAVVVHGWSNAFVAPDERDGAFEHLCARAPPALS